MRALTLFLWINSRQEESLNSARAIPVCPEPVQHKSPEFSSFFSEPINHSLFLLHTIFLLASLIFFSTQHLSLSFLYFFHGYFSWRYRRRQGIHIYIVSAPVTRTNKHDAIIQAFSIQLSAEDGLLVGGIGLKA